MADDSTIEDTGQEATHDGYADTPEAAVGLMTGGVSEPYQTVPTTQLDLAYRQAKERGEVPEVGEARSFIVEGNEDSLKNYAGVSPEYQGFGDPTQAPFRAEGGPEADIEARIMDGETPRRRSRRR